MTVVDVDGSEPPRAFRLRRPARDHCGGEPPPERGGGGPRPRGAGCRRRRSGRCATWPTTSAWSSGTGARTSGPRTPTSVPPASSPRFPEDADLLAWLGWCTYSLVGALREVGPDRPAGPGGPSPTRRAPWGGTRRRRCPCTAGTPRAWPGPSEPLHPGLADDGVPEFIEIMVGADLASLPGAVTLTATDTGASWRVAGDRGGPSGRPGSPSCGPPPPTWCSCSTGASRCPTPP